MAFDALVFSLTLTYRLRFGRATERGSLLTVIFRDGMSLILLIYVDTNPKTVLVSRYRILWVSGAPLWMYPGYNPAPIFQDSGGAILRHDRVICGLYIHRVTSTRSLTVRRSYSWLR